MLNLLVPQVPKSSKICPNTVLIEIRILKGKCDLLAQSKSIIREEFRFKSESVKCLYQKKIQNFCNIVNNNSGLTLVQSVTL